MNFEHILQFLIKHNALLIEITVTVILLLAGYLAYRSYNSEEQDELSGKVGSTDLSQLEESLKKILEKASQVPASNSGAISGDSAVLASEISTLKEELQKKQQEIEFMKTASTPAGAESQPASGLSGKEKDDLTAQIGELKKKLEEYDIISADIADLSFYKEENARLQKELAAKASGATSANQQVANSAQAVPNKSATESAKPAAPTATEPKAEEVQKASSSASTASDNTTTVVTGGGAAATDNEKIVVSGGSGAESTSAATTVTSGPPVENVIDDDIMRDFAAAVADAGTTGAKTPALGVSAAEGDQAAQAKGSTGAQDLGSLDIDRMVSEVAALPDASHAEDVNSLGQDMDPDKLALEASKLSDVKSEEKDLMGQFENFIKKEKT